MAHNAELGRRGEQLAVDHLAARGMAVLERNWRCRLGEIDIVARDGDDLVFIEVKTRSNGDYGHPFEAIDARKRVRLWRLAVAWAGAHRGLVQGRRLRIDAIGLTGTDPGTARLEHLVVVEVP